MSKSKRKQISITIKHIVQMQDHSFNIKPAISSYILKLIFYVQLETQI